MREHAFSLSWYNQPTPIAWRINIVSISGRSFTLTWYIALFRYTRLLCGTHSIPHNIPKHSFPTFRPYFLCSNTSQVLIKIWWVPSHALPSLNQAPSKGRENILHGPNNVVGHVGLWTPKFPWHNPPFRKWAQAYISEQYRVHPPLWTWCIYAGCVVWIHKQSLSQAGQSVCNPQISKIRTRL